MSAEPIITRGGTAGNGEAWKPENIRAYERLKEFKPKRVAWATPVTGSPTPMYPAKVVNSWFALEWPMNQLHTPHLEALNMEVGAAYEWLFESWLDVDIATERYGEQFARVLAGTQFMFTCEHDNVLPEKSVMELLAAIYTCIDCGGDIAADTWTCAEGHRGLDAIGGLYWCKGLPSRPMAYGDPKEGEGFHPISVTDAVTEGRVIEVNGIAMGCTLFRRGIFANISRPWFKTEGGTQDLYWAAKAKKEAGARLGVHCGIRVTHLDIAEGIMY